MTNEPIVCIIKRSISHHIDILTKMGALLCCSRKDEIWRFDRPFNLRPDAIRKITSQFSRPLAEFPIDLEDVQLPSSDEEPAIFVAREETEPRLLD